MSQPTVFPQFDAPPVVETVVGVFFRPIAQLTGIERFRYWETISAEFPDVEEKPPIEEVQEQLGGGSSDKVIRWVVSDSIPPSRLWAKSSDGKHTIQIQNNAFMANWERAAGSAGKYWPYTQRRNDFTAKLGSLVEFVRSRGIGDVRPTTCFCTYINHIEYDRQEELAPLLARILVFWDGGMSGNELPPAEHAACQLAYPLPGGGGRLHLNVAPGVRRPDKKRIVRVELTARSTPFNGSVDEALWWIDLGHEWIVRSFALLTRPEMHAQWRRIQ